MRTTGLTADSNRGDKIKPTGSVESCGNTGQKGVAKAYCSLIREQEVHSLEIDEEFKNLIPPLTTEEYLGLQKSILAEGCRDKLVVWNDTLVDGHNRHRICNMNNIPFETTEMSFESRNDAMMWIIHNQFNRRNLPIYEKTNLILKLEESIKAKAKENQGKRTDIPQNSAKSLSPIDTREELAKLAGVSRDTIAKVKIINKKATPEQIERLRTKEASINKIYKEVTAPPEVEEEELIEVETKSEVKKRKMTENQRILAAIEADHRSMLVPNKKSPEEDTKETNTDPIISDLIDLLNAFRKDINRITFYEGIGNYQDKPFLLQLAEKARNDIQTIINKLEDKNDEN